MMFCLDRPVGTIIINVQHQLTHSITLFSSLTRIHRRCRHLRCCKPQTCAFTVQYSGEFEMSMIGIPNQALAVRYGSLAATDNTVLYLKRCSSRVFSVVSTIPAVK